MSSQRCKSVICHTLPWIPRRPDLPLATARAAPLPTPAAIPGRIAHVILSGHCSNAAGLQAIRSLSSASTHWKNQPGSSELAEAERDIPSPPQILHLINPANEAQVKHLACILLPVDWRGLPLQTLLHPLPLRSLAWPLI